VLARVVLYEFDPDRRLARGQFYSRPAYEAVRPILARFTPSYTEPDGAERAEVDPAALERFERERAELALELVSRGGRVLPADRIELVEMGPVVGWPVPGGPVVVAISDEEYWRRYRARAQRARGASRPDA
jgi:hypothetical protein